MPKDVSIDRVPQIDFDSIRGWETLKPNEQALVRQETRELNETIQTAGKVRLAIGEHLSRVRDILGAKQHKGMWERWLKTLPFGISRATANRYIQNYEVARTLLPKPFVEVALMRETGLLDRHMITVNPPPKTRDREKIVEYLNTVTGKGSKRQEEAGDDPETLEKELILHYYRLYNRLPRHHQTRAAFFRSAASKMATISGLASEVTIKPSAVPPDFKPRPRGRPRLDGGANSAPSRDDD